MSHRVARERLEAGRHHPAFHPTGSRTTHVNVSLRTRRLQRYSGHQTTGRRHSREPIATAPTITGRFAECVKSCNLALPLISGNLLMVVHSIFIGWLLHGMYSQLNISFMPLFKYLENNWKYKNCFGDMTWKIYRTWYHLLCYVQAICYTNILIKKFFEQTFFTS